MIREISDHVTYILKESEKGWNHMQIYKKYPQEGKTMKFTHSIQTNVLIVIPRRGKFGCSGCSGIQRKSDQSYPNEFLEYVVFDLHQLQFIDSSGLGSFVVGPTDLAWQRRRIKASRA